MTGRGLQDQEDESSNNEEELEDKFDINQQVDGNVLNRKSQEGNLQYLI